MNKKLMYIFAIFIVAAITCISQPKKTTLRDKAMVNYAFDYLSSPGSLPFTTAATELSAIHGHSTSQYRLGEFYLHGSDGKPLDYTQARYWYEQSAEQENPRAQSKLGWIDPINTAAGCGVNAASGIGAKNTSSAKQHRDFAESITYHQHR